MACDSGPFDKSSASHRSTRGAVLRAQSCSALFGAYRLAPIARLELREHLFTMDNRATSPGCTALPGVAEMAFARQVERAKEALLVVGWDARG